MSDLEFLDGHFFPNKKEIKFHVFCASMEDMAARKRDNVHIIPQDRRNVVGNTSFIEK